MSVSDAKLLLERCIKELEYQKLVLSKARHEIYSSVVRAIALKNKFSPVHHPKCYVLTRDMKNEANWIYSDIDKAMYRIDGYIWSIREALESDFNEKVAK